MGRSIWLLLPLVSVALIPLRSPQEARRPTAIALGSFDGLHQGHRRVIASVTDQPAAVSTSVPSPVPTVVSFWPHPREVLHGEARLPLDLPAEKLHLLEPLGIQQLVLVPFTHDGLVAADELGRGAAVPRWIDRRSPPYATADALTAIVAGVKPWHHFDAGLDPEYEEDVESVPLPGFAQPAEGRAAPPLFDIGATPLGYVAPHGLDPVVTTALEALGAEATTWQDAPHTAGGTTVVLLDSGEELPQSVEQRDDDGRILALPGPVPQSHTVPQRWKHADWVLPGLWADVVASLREGPWTRAAE